MHPTLNRPVVSANTLLDEELLRAAEDEEISATIALLQAEQLRRALETGDPEALAQECFEESGFDRKGMPVIPYLRDGLLVCPGVKVEKSRTSHQCVFVSVGDEWVWENSDRVYDDNRQVSVNGNASTRRSVTIVPVHDGVTFDVVVSKASGGSSCQMQSARTFEVRDGDVHQIGGRTRSAAPAGGH